MDENSNIAGEGTSAMNTQSIASTSQSNEASSLNSAVESLQWQGALKKFKPMSSETIYYKIFFAQDELDDEIAHLFYHYFERKNDAITGILRVFLDFSGYFKLDIKQHYQILRTNPSQFITIFDSHQFDKYSSNEKCLFENASAEQKAASSGLTLFLQKLIYHTINEKIFNDHHFLAHVIDFAQAMSQSRLVPIYINGIIICSKLMKIFAFFSNTITENKSISSIKMPNLLQFEALISKLLVKLAEMLCSHYDINTDQCKIMKSICMDDLEVCIRLLPMFYLTKIKFIPRMKENIVCKTDLHVSLKAMKVLKTVMALSLPRSVQIKLVNYFQDIGQILRSTDDTITFATINLYVHAIDTGNMNLIDKKICIEMTELLFHPLERLAQEAAKFMALYFRMNQAKKEQVLVNLFKLLVARPEYLERVQRFVQIFLPHAYELTDCRLILKAVRSLSRNQQPIFLLMIKYTLYYHLTKEDYPAFQFPARLPALDEEKSDLISKGMLSVSMELLNVAHNEQYLINLLELFALTLLTNFQAAFNNSYRRLFGKMVEVFETSDNLQVGQLAVRVFHWLEQQNMAEDGVVAGLFEKYPVRLANILQLKESDAENLALKCAALYSKYDLRPHLTWDMMFANLNDSSHDLFVCCKESLMWQLREIQTTGEEDATTMSNLIHFEKQLKEFSDKTMELVRNDFQEAKRLKQPSHHLFIFNNLSQLLNDIDDELPNKSAISKFMKIIDQNTWIEFVLREMIQNNDLDLKARKTYLWTSLRVTTFEAVCLLTSFSVFLQDYVKYNEFNSIFDPYLEELAEKPPTLPLLIVRTCTKYYEKIFVEKVFSRDAVRIEMQNLFNLTREFATSNILKGDLKKFLWYGIKYASQNKFNFLHFIKVFLASLNASDKKEILKSLIATVPEKYLTVDGVAQFRDALKK